MSALQRHKEPRSRLGLSEELEARRCEGPGMGFSHGTTRRGVQLEGDFSELRRGNEDLVAWVARAVSWPQGHLRVRARQGVREEE
jgi:hypothetical protein